MNKFKKTAIEAALKSGRFIKRSVGKIKNISYKGRINIVTDVDKAAEKIILHAIRVTFPDHSILSEESRPQNRNSSYKWIIDPLDGTTNFTHSFPFFCVSIALECEGETILGVVYDPMRNELFHAEYGLGAYMNKKRICVSKVKKLSQSLLATGFAYGLKGANDTNVKNFENLLMRAMGIRRAGSAALDLCYTACGRFDGFWELDLHPWDSAAGSLIVTEAGGRVTKFNGHHYTPYDKDILASNQFISPQISALLAHL